MEAMSAARKRTTAELQRLFSAALPSELLLLDEPMAGHTSFEIGGPADVFLVPRSYAELTLCLEVVKRYAPPFFLLGGGTNILVADRGIRGVVIATGGLNHITIDSTTLIAQTGAQVRDVCCAAAEAALSGLEFIHGMPGSIGGAVWMNARCYGNSIADVLAEAEVIDEQLKLISIDCDPSQFAYKQSPFQQMAGCIWQVRLELQHGEREAIQLQMEQNHRDRVDKGHFRAPSAGSLFKNNRDFGAPTGKIIDELGLRGATVGGAAIAPFHGNIFINQNKATANDVLALIRLAVETAARERHIHLEPEVRLIGDWEPGALSFLKTGS